MQFLQFLTITSGSAAFSCLPRLSQGDLSNTHMICLKVVTGNAKKSREIFYFTCSQSPDCSRVYWCSELNHLVLWRTMDSESERWRKTTQKYKISFLKDFSLPCDFLVQTKRTRMDVKDEGCDSKRFETMISIHPRRNLGSHVRGLCNTLIASPEFETVSCFISLKAIKYLLILKICFFFSIHL